MKKAASGVDNTARRQWDKEEFAKRAAEREKEQQQDEDQEETLLDIKKRKRRERDPLHQGLIVQRSHLKGRDYQLELASRIGKTQVVGLNTPLNQQAGYYCNVCDCVLRDSQSYMDHINGKWHNRALGMSMRVEQASLEQVKNRLAMHKNKQQSSKPEDYLPDGVDKRLLEQEEAEQREREERRERKKRERDGAADEAGGEDDDGIDPEMRALMGFGGFGSSKR